MSFQAYLDAIEQKTGKSPDEFVDLARQKGYLDPGTKAGEIIAWLKEDYGLGRGHAMALVGVFKSANDPDRRDRDERLNRIFSGKRARWRGDFDQLMERVRQFGPGVSARATDSYVSILKDEQKFAIVQFTADRMDIGVKLKGRSPSARFEDAGSWNAMVTHRARIAAAAEIDEEIVSWLRDAYSAS